MGSLYRSQHELVFVFKAGTAPHINNVELGKHGRYARRRQKDHRACARSGRWAFLYPVKDIARLLIRRELLHPLLGIRASACYLRELIDQVIAKGTIKNYTLGKATPWGEYDFSVIRDPCTDDLVTVSSVSDASVVRVWLVAFFAAAHNDDALSGFREGIGLTQGDNALGIAFDLERMDLWDEYDLLDCD